MASQGMTPPGCILGDKTSYFLHGGTTSPGCILGNKNPYFISFHGFTGALQGATFLGCIFEIKTPILFSWLHMGTTSPGCILGYKNSYFLMVSQGLFEKLRFNAQEYSISKTVRVSFDTMHAVA
ncbi:hypothetical protein HAX54_013211 [Datura stramonium]|uniref:Uncharacterized protein n=1 Tax=Datura stramonium TaxID=4076 RepID=A0ABS8TMY2_DATST|nr:hypothetical protein [Datura stramonium]